MKFNNETRVNQDETEDIGIITHYKGKPFTGIVFAAYENGFVARETEMLEGLRHGKETKYHDDDDYSINYFENDLKIGHDNHTYDKITNEVFPNEKYNDLEEILKKIEDKIKFLKIMDDVMVKQGYCKQNSESYYDTLSKEMIASLLRQKKFSENVYDQAEERSNKDNDNCERTIKFTDELKKYVKSHNDNAVIEVFPSNGSVWEEYIYRGTWNSKKFKMKASIPLKNADYQYDGSLSEFIEEIGNKKITELDDSNLNLELLGDSGGSWQVDEITWNPKLTKEEEEEVDVYNLVDFEMDYEEDEFIFDKGCIEEIKVTIEDKVFTLVK